MSILPILILAAAAAPTPDTPAAEVVSAEPSATVWRTATFAVRATVAHRCTISARGAECRGAAGRPPMRRIDSPDGLTIIEF